MKSGAGVGKGLVAEPKSGEVTQAESEKQSRGQHPRGSEWLLFKRKKSPAIPEHRGRSVGRSTIRKLFSGKSGEN